MNLLIIFGCIGGILYAINLSLKVIKAIKDYFMELGAREERSRYGERDRVASSTMGFKTKKEKQIEELEAKLSNLRGA